MSHQIPEPDWKLFRQLHPVALDRFCAQALAEARELLATAGTSNHQQFLDLYKLMRRHNEELADTFNDFRRSTAILFIARMRHMRLLTEAEIARFSPETRAVLDRYLDLGRD